MSISFDFLIPDIIAFPHSSPGKMSRGVTQQRTPLNSNAEQIASVMFLSLDECDMKTSCVIIAFEDDVKIYRALTVAPNIDFYTYQVSFRLEKKCH